MTHEEYALRNLEGFEGDRFIKLAIKSLVKKHGIKLIIETGTYKGGTTKQFAKMVPEVITIEVNDGYYLEARKNNSGVKNVLMIHGSSPEFLSVFFKELGGRTPNVLMFLDAHWGNVCPLLDELHEIAISGIKPVIVIHDFYVPGKDFGYDSYNGHRFDFDFIKESLSEIYGDDGYKYFYNEQAEGAQRGVIYIEPK